MTRTVYAAEDLFTRLPVHWSWWPAIGGFVVGVGGLIDPRVLGVGYDTISDELAGRMAIGALVLLLGCKLVVWAIALGSNTSGGILAPLLMMGAAVGAILGHVLPDAPTGTYALLGLAAALAGVTRSPLTSIVFAIELTHQTDALLPILVACFVAHMASVLALPRSILTEKIARRGYHVNREYDTDPLQVLFVRDVMSTDVLTFAPETALHDVYEQVPEGSEGRRQRLYPVLGQDGALEGVLAWSDVLEGKDADDVSAASRIRVAITARADETLRDAADRMVLSGHGVLPVIDPADPRRLVGLVDQFDLLRAHETALVEERHRERPLATRLAALPALFTRGDGD